MRWGRVKTMTMAIVFLGACVDGSAIEPSEDTGSQANSLSPICQDADHDGAYTCLTDCDDSDPSVVPERDELQPWPASCEDLDLDGWPACSTAPANADCDDSNSRVSPAVDETCNGVDDDCDGLIDEYITNCETAERSGPPSRRDGVPEEPDPQLPADCVDVDRDGSPFCPVPWVCLTSSPSARPPSEAVAKGHHRLPRRQNVPKTEVAPIFHPFGVLGVFRALSRG